MSRLHHSLSEELHAVQERTEQNITLGGHTMTKADLVKFIGLIVFFVIMGIVCVALWPLMHELFEPNGIQSVVKQVKDAGMAGVFVLFALQFLQIVVAFIPGEITQVAAGLIYGPIWGGIIILLGCIVSSGFIYEMVHRLGAPFVQAFVPKKVISTFDKLEQSGRLSLIVFILFVIPAMPKDAFTYLVPLTRMSRRRFLILTTVGRTPGVFLSTYAAAGLSNGRVEESLILFGVLIVLAIIAVIFRGKILNALSSNSGN